MKKLFVMAAMVLSSVGAFAQYNAGDITIQPKVGLSIADMTDLDDSKTRAGKHPTPIAIQLHPQCLLGIQSILRNWTFLIFKQV